MTEVQNLTRRIGESVAVGSVGPTILGLVAAALIATGCSSGSVARPQPPAAATAPPVAASPRTPSTLRGLPRRAATVWAVGDGADGGQDSRDLAGLIRRGRPDLFLYLGDVYETGSAAEFRTHYDALYGRLARRTAPTPGNHEYPGRRTGYDPYWHAVMGDPVPDHYRLRVAGWDVLSVDSEAPHGRSSAQVAWLRGRLAAPGTCRIVFWHRPRFSAGLHGDAADMAPVWDAVRGRAALVLNGHDHTSQRLRSSGGTTEIVAGGGGHRPYPLNAGDQRLAYASTGEPTALRLALTPGAARVSFVRRDGAVLDRTTVGCRR